MRRLLVTTEIQDRGLEMLRERFEVQVQRGLSQDELIKIIPRFEILLVRSETKVTKDVITAGVNLKVIGRVGMGLDNVDVEEAKKRGISVLNSPGGNSIAVAELVFATVLVLFRQIREADSAMKAGVWNKSELKGRELHGKTLGIIGFGRIGQIVARIGAAFGMRVLAYDLYVPQEVFESLGVVHMNSVDELVGSVDVLTIHVPKTEQTSNLIGRRELGLMKRSAVLINCARGGIVNEQSLYEALLKRDIAGAAIDTWEIEPSIDSSLQKLPNVLALPHIGASTYEAQERCLFDLIEQLFSFEETCVVI